MVTVNKIKGAGIKAVDTGELMEELEREKFHPSEYQWMVYLGLYFKILGYLVFSLAVLFVLFLFLKQL